MYVERIEKLKQEYTGQIVMIDSDRPELARLKNVPGKVRTVNFNGRALVEFDGVDRTWYDLEIDYLKVVDKSEPNGTEAPAAEPLSKAPNKPEPSDEIPPTQKLSRLELARLQKAGTEE
jgi:hypothetical protein